VSNNLKFSSHCHKITSKALRTLGLLFRSFVSTDHVILTNAYRVYVRPLLEFSTCVWSPCLKKDIRIIERVQHKFTFRVFKRCNMDGSTEYSDRCKFLDLESLELRRLKYDLLMCHKIMHNHVNVDASEFFSINTNGLRGSKTFKINVQKSQSWSQAFHNFFSKRVVNMWNNLLPETIVEIKDTTKFKKAIKNVDLSKYMNKKN